MIHPLTIFVGVYFLTGYIVTFTMFRDTSRLDQSPPWFYYAMTVVLWPVALTVAITAMIAKLKDEKR